MLTSMGWCIVACAHPMSCAALAGRVLCCSWIALVPTPTPLTSIYQLIMTCIHAVADMTERRIAGAFVWVDVATDVAEWSHNFRNINPRCQQQRLCHLKHTLEPRVCAAIGARNHQPANVLILEDGIRSRVGVTYPIAHHLFLSELSTSANLKADCSCFAKSPCQCLQCIWRTHVRPHHSQPP